MVYPELTGVFGAPSDIDGNGRVVLFFTPASNRLAPPQSGGIVGGYFWGGDLFPADAGGGTGLEPYANSSQAEVLYLSVPDALTRRELLYTRATLAHEFQHLLNAARRIHLNQAPVLEESWLNEGLSYLAEELIFYRTTGLGPGANLSEPALREAGAVEAFNEFAYNNLGRYNVFLLGPHFHSVMGSDGAETRGAAWSFLRYALDRLPGSDAPVLGSLLNSVGQGRATLESAGIPDPLGWMAEWAVSLAVDDLAGVPEARFRQPSWNLPAIIRDLRPDARYPLHLIPVEPGLGVRFSLRPGGAGFGSVHVRAGERATIRVQPQDRELPVRAFLVRIR